MAEIEFSVMSRSSLPQRLADEVTVRRGVQTLVAQRNTAQTTINWRSTSQKA